MIINLIAYPIYNIVIYFISTTYKYCIFITIQSEPINIFLIEFLDYIFNCGYDFEYVVNAVKKLNEQQ